MPPKPPTTPQKEDSEPTHRPRSYRPSPYTSGLETLHPPSPRPTDPGAARAACDPRLGCGVHGFHVVEVNGLEVAGGGIAEDDAEDEPDGSENLDPFLLVDELAIPVELDI